MNELMKEVMNYLIQWGPSICSIITMIATVIVALRRVNNSNNKCLKETREIQKRFNEILKENATLKKYLTKAINKLNHIKEED